MSIFFSAVLLDVCFVICDLFAAFCNANFYCIFQFVLCNLCLFLVFCFTFVFVL